MSSKSGPTVKLVLAGARVADRALEKLKSSNTMRRLEGWSLQAAVEGAKLAHKMEAAGVPGKLKQTGSLAWDVVKMGVREVSDDVLGPSGKEMREVLGRRLNVLRQVNQWNKEHPELKMVLSYGKNSRELRNLVENIKGRGVPGLRRMKKAMRTLGDNLSRNWADRKWGKPGMNWSQGKYDRLTNQGCRHTDVRRRFQLSEMRIVAHPSRRARARNAINKAAEKVAKNFVHLWKPSSSDEKTPPNYGVVQGLRTGRRVVTIKRGRARVRTEGEKQFYKQLELNQLKWHQRGVFGWLRRGNPAGWFNNRRERKAKLKSEVHQKGGRAAVYALWAAVITVAAPKVLFTVGLVYLWVMHPELYA